jgi:superfamily II DNA or RNA helicase
VYETLRLYEVRGKPEYLVVPAGLYARIITTLNAYNYPYVFEDLRPVKLSEPKWADIDEPREGQEVILAKIAACHMGQIEAPTGDGKTWIIVQVCRMYPDARIVIVVPGIDVAKTIRDRLLGALPSLHVGQLGGGRHERDKRVTVCVRNSLRKADLEHCQILMYDECHTAASDKTARSLTLARGCKMFGFSASTGLRTDKADMLAEALFGPVIHVTEYAESQQLGNIVPIRVIMRPVVVGPSIASTSTQILNKHGIWCNDERNRRIAEDAREYSKNGEQILIAVTTVIHGLELLRYLKDDFTFVYAQMDANLRKAYEKLGVIEPGVHPITTNERGRLQEEFEAGRLRRVITTCWKHGVSFDHLQVLIRADGLATNIDSVQLPGRLSRLDDGKDCGTLIDYLDQFNSTLANRAKQRVRMYRRKKWDVIIPRQIGIQFA